MDLPLTFVEGPVGPALLGATAALLLTLRQAVEMDAASH
jgi:hypothetical protein